MPFFKYKCDDCGLIQEVLHRHTVSGALKPTEEELTCGHEECFDPDNLDEDTLTGCGSNHIGRVFEFGSFSIHGQTGSNHNGFYSDNLGCYVKSRKEEDAIARDRGLIRVSDISKDNLDRAFEKEMETAYKHQSDAERFKAGEKLEDIYSVDRMKDDGLLDSNIKGDL